MKEQTENAFILRIKFHLEKALEENQLIIGWAHADGLINDDLSYHEFHEIIRQTYYSGHETRRGSGQSAGHLWRFIRDMKEGDLVVVPYRPDFYVARITGPATYDPSLTSDDSSYRRSVEWLNGKNPIPMGFAEVALRRKMKIRGTSANAGEVIAEIERCLSLAKAGATPDFYGDLQVKLVKETLQSMQRGQIGDHGFEELIKRLLIGLGGKGVDIIPRRHDKGVDVVATFSVAGMLEQKIGVQVKQFDPEPGVRKEVIEKLVEGLEQHGADIGMVITTGTISDEAKELVEEYSESGVRIELVDGERLAEIIVENGLATIF